MWNQFIIRNNAHFSTCVMCSFNPPPRAPFADEKYVFLCAELFSLSCPFSFRVAGRRENTFRNHRLYVPFRVLCQFHFMYHRHPLTSFFVAAVPQSVHPYRNVWGGCFSLAVHKPKTSREENKNTFFMLLRSFFPISTSLAKSQIK